VGGEDASFLIAWIVRNWCRKVYREVSYHLGRFRGIGRPECRVLVVANERLVRRAAMAVCLRILDDCIFVLLTPQV
jgi:hypothetical protein